MPESRDHNRLRNLLRICCHLRRPEHFAADPALVICFRSWLCTGNKCFIHLYDIVILDRGCRLIFRYTINEDKLLAKLEANKRKPMKKSGFMKRLEEAQRAQQETLRKQQEAKKKR